MHLFQSNVSMGEALGYSVLGMAIVFAVLIVLMLVVKMMETFTAKGQNAEALPCPFPPRLPLRKPRPPSPRPALPDS